MSNAMESKQLAGERAAELVENGMTVGLGTGSTVYWTILRLGERIRQGLSIRAIPTSRQTEALALREGIPLTSFAEVHQLDLTIDGADEVSPALDLIKGGGGALLREKLVAAHSGRLVIVVDAAKLVPVLGAFPLPVEVIPFGWEATVRLIAPLASSARLRLQEGRPLVTDNGNYIVDLSCGAIADPAVLDQRLRQVPGVVETGLFVAMAHQVLVGEPEGVRLLQRA